MFMKIPSETFKKSDTEQVYRIGISVWRAWTLLLRKKTLWRRLICKERTEKVYYDWQNQYCFLCGFITNETIEEL